MEILLYGSMNNYSAADFIEKMEAAKGVDVDCRMNCSGGDVFAGWGMIAKMQEHGAVNIKVDGIAASMAAFALPFAASVECIDSSSFLFHRADGYVSTEEDKKWLSAINMNFRKKMEAKIPAALWKEITGKSYDELFSEDSRIDVILNAKQAKKLGLVSKINTLTVSEAKKIKADVSRLPVEFRAELPVSIEAVIKETIVPTPTPNPTPKNMTLSEFQAAHPDLFKQINDNAVKAERDRVGSFMVYNGIDPVAVAAGIASGEPLSATQRETFSLAAIEKKALGGLPATATPTGEAETIDTSKPADKVEAEKKIAEFMKEASAGLTSKNSTEISADFKPVLS